MIKYILDTLIWAFDEVGKAIENSIKIILDCFKL